MPVRKKKLSKKKKIPNKVDQGGVSRILSPYSPKFEKSKPMKCPADAMPLSPFRKTALSPKEKNYILCNCQTRSSRYTKLKSLASDAIKNKKIFMVHGSCNAVRKALIERGWVEKIPPNVLDVNKIRNKTFNDVSGMHNALERLLLSNFVEKYHPNFIWNVKEGDFNNFNDFEHETWIRNNNVIYNKLRVDGLWTTKQGLCATIKNSHWFYIEDVSEVYTPRTYTSFDEGERLDFEDDYKLTACTSLLKWVLSMIASDKPIFKDTGTIGLNVIVFALNRCKEFLFRKQNLDIDKIFVATATAGQWNSFLKKYYALIAKEDFFGNDKDNKLPLYLGYAKYLLREILKYRPQLTCEGCLNIWIIKPAHCSRGRGIRMASKLGVLSALAPKGKYVFQKYVEEPLLVHATKFDIRQYYLVTNTSPLVIWMYKDCYLKFSSQKYNLKNFHESIHLTNNAVQKKYKNCQGRHPELPQHNMWDLETYKLYLNKIGKDGVWDTVIYPGMKKSIVSIMLSCQESMTYNKNRFELYGCDFILDKDYKPWLIEINSCPDFNPTTEVTAKICPAVLTDTIKVVVDYVRDNKASTGNFECIFRQSLGTPRYGASTDLTVRGTALPLEYFYRGKLPLDYKQTPKTQKENVKDILRKMKMRNHSESSKTSGSRNSSQKIVIKASEKNKLQEEYEKFSVSTIITKKLDGLIDKITADYNQHQKANSNLFNNSSSTISTDKSLTNALSVTDLPSLATKPIERFASTDLLIQRKKFDLGSLNLEVPIGNRSDFVFFNQFGENPKMTMHSGKTIKFERKAETPVFKNESGNLMTKIRSLNSIAMLTNKLYCFLNEKEEEYKGDLALAPYPPARA